MNEKIEMHLSIYHGEKIIETKWLGTNECSSELCILNPQGYCLAPLITGHYPVCTDEGCMTCIPKDEIPYFTEGET